MVGALKEPKGLFAPKNEGRLFQTGDQGKQQPHTGRSQPGNEVMGRVVHAQWRCVREPCRRQELSSLGGWKQVSKESWEVSLERSTGPCMGA